MRMIIFQVVNASESNQSRSFPVWVFWLLVFIIAVLLIFILIRDKRVRAKIRAFFSWIGSKIRMARIKSKINRKTQEKMKVIARLGQLAWDAKIDIPEIESENEEIKKLKADEALINDEIQKLDAEIEKNRTVIERYNQNQAKKISDIEVEKKPLDVEYKKLNSQKDQVEGELKENEKLKTKVARNLKHHEQEIDKIEKDTYLSKIEKEMKRKENEKAIDELKKNEIKATEKLDSLREKLENVKKKIDELRGQISKFEDKIKIYESEQQQHQKKNDEQIDNLQKSRKALNIKNIGLQKQLSVLLKKTGEKLNQNRPDRAELKEIYSQIDLIDHRIQELESKMK